MDDEEGEYKAEYLDTAEDEDPEVIERLSTENMGETLVLL